MPLVDSCRLPDGMALDDIPKSIIRDMRDRAERTAPMPFSDVIAQTLAPKELFDSIVVDGNEWRLGYGIEMQQVGPCRHLSISHSSGKRFPELWLIKELILAFGFGDTVQIDAEPYRHSGMTVHVMEPYKLLTGPKDATVSSP